MKVPIRFISSRKFLHLETILQVYTKKNTVICLNYETGEKVDIQKFKIIQDPSINFTMIHPNR